MILGDNQKIRFLAVLAKNSRKSFAVLAKNGLFWLAVLSNIPPVRGFLDVKCQSMGNLLTGTNRSRRLDVDGSFASLSKEEIERF